MELHVQHGVCLRMCEQDQATRDVAELDEETDGASRKDALGEADCVPRLVGRPAERSPRVPADGSAAEKRTPIEERSRSDQIAHARRREREHRPENLELVRRRSVRCSVRGLPSAGLRRVAAGQMDGTTARQCAAANRLRDTLTADDLHQTWTRPRTEGDGEQAREAPAALPEVWWKRTSLGAAGRARVRDDMSGVWGERSVLIS